MNPLNKMMKFVFPDCKEVAELTSFSLEETLPLKKRLGLKLHIMFCKFCRRNNEQLFLIRKLIRKQIKSADQTDAETDSCLSEESRLRISKKLKSTDTDHSSQS